MLTNFTNGIGPKMSEINDIILSGSGSTFANIFSNWPNIIAAISILLIGWLFSSLIERILLKLVQKFKIDILFHKLKFEDFLEKAQVKSSPTKVIVNALKGYIFTFFFLTAARLLKFDYVANFLDAVINFLPKLAVALIIILVGFSFANTVSAFVKNMLKIADMKSAVLLSGIAKYVIITFTILGALMQIDIAPRFLDILFIGFVSAISLGLGLAFGIGGSKFVSHRLEEFLNKAGKKIK